MMKANKGLQMRNHSIEKSTANLTFTIQSYEFKT